MKNLKKLMSLCAFATLLTGFSIAEGAPLPIEGAWGMTQAQGPFTFDMTFTIANGTITLTNVCSLQGNSATARVSSPAQYDDRTLTTLENAEDHESAGGVNCDVSLKPDRMNYQVIGNQLILSHDGSADRFTLVRR